MLAMECDVIDLILVALAFVISLRVLFIFLIRPLLVPFGLVDIVLLQPLLFVVVLFVGLPRWLHITVEQQLTLLPGSTLLRVMECYGTLLVDF